MKYRYLILNTHVLYALGFEHSTVKGIKNWILRKDDEYLPVLVQEVPGNKQNEEGIFVSRSFFLEGHQVWDLVSLIQTINSVLKSSMVVRLLLDRVMELNMEAYLPDPNLKWLVPPVDGH